MNPRRSLSLGAAALLSIPFLGFAGTASAQATDNIVISGLPSVVGFEAAPLEFTVTVSGVEDGAGQLVFEAEDLFESSVDRLVIEIFNEDSSAWEHIDFSEGAASIDVQDGVYGMRVSHQLPEDEAALLQEDIAGDGASRDVDTGAGETFSAETADACGQVTDVAFRITLNVDGTPLESEDLAIGLGHPSAIIDGFPVTLVAGESEPHEFAVTPCNDTDSDYPEIFLDIFVVADPSGEDEDARLRPEDVVIEWLDDSGEWVELETEGFADTIVVTLDAVGPYELLAQSTGESATFRISFTGSAQARTVFLSSGLLAPTEDEDLIFVGESPFVDINVKAPDTTPPPSSPPPGQGGQGGPKPELPSTGAGNSLAMGLVGMILVVGGATTLLIARKRGTRQAA